jgi:hypothetical protein
MQNAQFKHLLGLLATLFTAVLAIWVGPTAVGDTTAKITQSIIVAAGLIFTVSKITEKKQMILGGITILGTILTFVAMKLPAGSAALGMVPTLFAVLTNLKTALGGPGSEVSSKGGSGIGPFSAALVLFGLLSLGLGGKAQAATSAYWDGLTYVVSETWTCSPVAALTGYQLNLKTTTFQQGVSLGAGFGCRYTGLSVPLSIEAVGGFAANTNAPNAVQGNLILVVADNFGVGPGTQVFKDPVTGGYTGQMLVSFFLTGSWASTVAQSKAVRQKMAAQQVARAQP